MRDWLGRQWKDVSGNVKFYVILAVGAPVITSGVAITHALSLWQQVGLVACFLVMFGLALWGRTGSLRSAVAPATTTAPKVLSAAPQLLVEYRTKDPKQKLVERLVFINDSDPTLKISGVGPLLWKVVYRREINLHNVLPPVRGHASVECNFAAYEQLDQGITHLQELPEMLRDMMGKIGPEHQAEVEIFYENMNNEQFSRIFLLSIDPWNRVAWDPAPVRQLPDKPKALDELGGSPNT